MSAAPTPGPATPLPWFKATTVTDGKRYVYLWDDNKKRRAEAFDAVAAEIILRSVNNFPDLVAALEAAEKCLNDAHGCVNTASIRKLLFDGREAARAALRKALGEDQ